MKHTLIKYCIFTLLVQALLSSGVLAQTLRPFRLPSDVKKQSMASAELSLGYSTPQGRSGLREFWLAGPNLAAKGLIHINSVFALGLGADFSILYFDQNAFALRWPGISLVEKPNLFVTNVSLHGIYALLPNEETRPFVGVDVGVEIIPRTVYQRIVDGVRYTYYNVGGASRIAFGVTVGVNHRLDDDFGIHAEVKSTFIHNDPNASVLLGLRAGVQYKF